MPQNPLPHRKMLKRINEPGHAHELTFSCNHRWPMLSRDRTRHWLIEAIGTARQRHDFQIWAYVIMPEHVHLLIFPNQPFYDTGLILKAIKQPVARRAVAYLQAVRADWLEKLKVPRPSGKTEYRFWQQGSGYDRNAISLATIREMIDYIHNNPVRRGLATSPLDWPWSSARWYAGMADPILPIDDPSKELS